MLHSIGVANAVLGGWASRASSASRWLGRRYLGDRCLGLGWVLASALGAGLAVLVLDRHPGVPILAWMVLSLVQGAAVFGRRGGARWAIGTFLGELFFRWVWGLGYIVALVGTSLWTVATSSWRGILDALILAPLMVIMSPFMVDLGQELGDVPLRAGQYVQVTWQSVISNGLGFAAAGALLGATQASAVGVPQDRCGGWIAASAVGGILIAPVFMADWATWWVFSPIIAPDWLVAALGGLGYGLVTGPLLGGMLDASDS